jgi:RNA polymerase sigma-70 factor (ECF subfamily)
LDSLGLLLESCRSYLRLLANRTLEEDLQSKASASDLVQETFLEAQRDFASFTGRTEAELFCWLRRILLHNIGSFARHYRATGKRQTSRELSLAYEVGSRSLDETLVDRCDGPTKRLLEREEQEQLEVAMTRLPDHYREIILLRHRDHMSFAEIGCRMNRTEDAAQKLWGRAVEELRKEVNRLS